MQTVADSMTSTVRACAPHVPLSDVARTMWEADCGAVPLVDGEGRPLGLVTDRDVCMAALLSGRALHEIAAAQALPARELLSCRPGDDLARAHELMRTHQVRRLPVLDDDGVLVGMLSLGDLARPADTSAARRTQADALLLTLAGVVRPTGTSLESALPTGRAKARKAPAKAKAKPAAKAAAKPATKAASAPASDTAKAAAEAGKPTGSTPSQVPASPPASGASPTTATGGKAPATRPARKPAARKGAKRAVGEGGASAS